MRLGARCRRLVRCAEMRRGPSSATPNPTSVGESVPGIAIEHPVIPPWGLTSTGFGRRSEDLIDGGSDHTHFGVGGQGLRASRRTARCVAVEVARTASVGWAVRRPLGCRTAGCRTNGEWRRRTNEVHLGGLTRVPQALKPASPSALLRSVGGEGSGKAHGSIGRWAVATRLGRNGLVGGEGPEVEGRWRTAHRGNMKRACRRNNGERAGATVTSSTAGNEGKASKGLTPSGKFARASG